MNRVSVNLIKASAAATPLTTASKGETNSDSSGLNKKKGRWCVKTHLRFCV